MTIIDKGAGHATRTVESTVHGKAFANELHQRSESVVKVLFGHYSYIRSGSGYGSGSVAMLPWSCRSSIRIPRAHPAPGCPSSDSGGSPGRPGDAARPLPINIGWLGLLHHVSGFLRIITLNNRNILYIYILNII